MTTEDLMKLREMAEAATRAKDWKVLPARQDMGYEESYSIYIEGVGALGYWKGHKSCHTDADWLLKKDDAEFICAANPAKVIELLDALEAQAREIAELEKQHIERLLRIEQKVDLLIAERDNLLERLAASQKEELDLRAELAELKAASDLSWPLVNSLSAERDKLSAELAAIRATQEPVAFLCDATRFKVFRCEGDENGRILGLPRELNGRWVALVAADDDCHLNAVASPDVGALVKALELIKQSSFNASVVAEKALDAYAITQSQAARVPDASPVAKDAGLVAALFERCTIIYWPKGGEYPIEHNARANKNSKAEITAALSTNQTTQQIGGV